MKEKNPTFLLVVLAVLAGTLGLVLGKRLTTPDYTTAQVGTPAPPVALPGLDGRVRPLTELTRGRPTVVNFWATWCGPCIEEMPLLDAFATSQGANGTQVVGIALDDRAAVEAFLRRTPVRYPQLLDDATGRDTSPRFGNSRNVLPYTVLIGADGRIAAAKFGAFEAGELEDFTAR